MITKNVRAFSLAIGLGVASSLICATDVFAATFTYDDTVGGMANLFHDDWGHPYNMDMLEGDLYTYSAVGDGEAPTAFGNGLVFSGNQSIKIMASGCVVDSGPDCTGPDGGESRQTFRGLTRYGLIGMWSSTPDQITPIGPIEPGSNPAFNVGSSADLTTPNYDGNIYLFLAENDGDFADNTDPSQVYNITLTTDSPTTPGTSVPEPSSLLGMFGVASLAMFFRKRL